MMFRKMPVILLSFILLIVVLNPWISIEAKSQIYAVSLFVKSCIVFVLPILIFMLLFKTMAQVSKGATKLIGLILASLCLSNFMSTMIGYCVGASLYHIDFTLTSPPQMRGLEASWVLQFPKWIANDQAMFGALTLGFLGSMFVPAITVRIAAQFDRWTMWIFRMLTALVPIFVIGFVVKLIHDKLLKQILSQYAVILIVIAVSVFAYIIFIYFIASRLRIIKSLGYLKNMLPAAITGLSSMSSAAAMPLTIEASEKNTEDPQLARLAAPMTVSTHLMGDCFAIPILAFAVMKHFGMAEPTLGNYVIFALYFVLAKFSVAAIPGGGIIVMLPILEKQLGFTSEMGSLITALYILFDPVITCANIMGNGGFALVISRVRKGLQKVF
jgi:Na+/H+-dicarboxylate symporter